MSDTYVGEIRMFGGNFAPVDWAFCNGQLMSIADYSQLYALIGTTYGGDGSSTFGLPDLQGRLPLHAAGSSIALSTKAGSESVSLNSNQIPAHDHPYYATTNAASTANPANALLAAAGSNIYFNTTNPPPQNMASNMNPAGGNQPHANIMPYLAVSFIISLYGTFPQQN